MSQSSDQSVRTSRRTPPYLSVTAVRARGWTPTLIGLLLGEPDRVKASQRSAMRFYRRQRVLAAERKLDLATFHMMATLRSKRAIKGSDTKRCEVLNRVKSLTVTVNRIPARDLEIRAINFYNNRAAYLGKCPTSALASRPFLNRITVNVIRHQLTAYDRQLERLIGQVGRQDAADLLKTKVYTAIAAAYPDYAEECQAQLARRLAEKFG